MSIPTTRPPFPTPSGTLDDSALDWRKYYEWEAGHKRFLPGEEPGEHFRVDFVFRLLEGITYRRVLDAGCGNGYLASRLAARAGDRTLGSDLSLGRLREGRDLFRNVGFARATLFDQPFPDRSFDLVTAVEVVEHLASPEQAVAELKRISSRFVLVTVPYRGALEVLHCPHCDQSFHVDGHIQSFDEARLERIVRDAGLTVRRLEAYVPYYPPTRPPMNLLPRPLHRLIRGGFVAMKLARPTRAKFLGVLAERMDAAVGTD